MGTIDIRNASIHSTEMFSYKTKQLSFITTSHVLLCFGVMIKVLLPFSVALHLKGCCHWQMLSEGKQRQVMSKNWLVKLWEPLISQED